jgi:hypothetical protein
VLAQTSRTAVYGPVRTVVWEGSAGDCRPYPDQSRLYEMRYFELVRVIFITVIREAPET